MANKTKTKKSTVDQLNEVAQSAGLVLMTAAVTMGMLEMPDQLKNKIIVPNQPSYAEVGNTNSEDSNNLRREREESAPHFISYSTVQRTPSRAGRR